MRADLRACEPLPAGVEHVGRERAAEPPYVAGRHLCGNCRHFSVLDDAAKDEDKWYGVCLIDAADELGVECATWAALDYCFYHGRHAADEPEHDDCFEEA